MSQVVTLRTELENAMSRHVVLLCDLEAFLLWDMQWTCAQSNSKSQAISQK